jgi:NAD(P)H dehydrogenase (quinone)
MMKFWCFVIFLFEISYLSAQDSSRILIVFYSQQGHTESMAYAVEKGASSVDNIVVRTLPVEDAKNADVLWADAIILGSPVYNANVAPAILSFINNWPFQGEPLKNKIGAAFVTAGGISAGEEFVQLNLIKSMLIFGMIIVGGPDWTQAFGAFAVVEEEPFKKEKAGEIAPQFLQKGERLGRRVAEVTRQWNRNQK